MSCNTAGSWSESVPSERRADRRERRVVGGRGCNDRRHRSAASDRGGSKDDPALSQERRWCSEGARSGEAESAVEVGWVRSASLDADRPVVLECVYGRRGSKPCYCSNGDRLDAAHGWKRAPDAPQTRHMHAKAVRFRPDRANSNRFSRAASHPCNDLPARAGQAPRCHPGLRRICAFAPVWRAGGSNTARENHSALQGDAHQVSTPSGLS